MFSAGCFRQKFPNSKSIEEDKPVFPRERAKLQPFQDTCCPPVFAFGSALRHRNMTEEGSWRHKDTIPMQERNINKCPEGQKGGGKGAKWAFIFSKLYRKDI